MESDDGWSNRAWGEQKKKKKSIRIWKTSPYAIETSCDSILHKIVQSLNHLERVNNLDRNIRSFDGVFVRRPRGRTWTFENGSRQPFCKWGGAARCCHNFRDARHRVTMPRYYRFFSRDSPSSEWTRHTVVRGPWWNRGPHGGHSANFFASHADQVAKYAASFALETCMENYGYDRVFRC